MSAFDRTRCTRPLAVAFLAASLAALATASTAAAPMAGTAARADTEANVSSDVKKGFDELDKNGDGMISRDEAAADTRLNKTFAQYDRNRNGTISLAEWDRFCADVNAAEPGLEARDAIRVAKRK
jgi:Ca2+-binding EF-hand superfamily protein